jgi:hypothetical protein
MSDRDDFDRIVEGLNLHLSFPDEPADPVEQGTDDGVRTEPDAPDAADAEEPFYRRVDPTPIVPRRRGVFLAWCGVLGTPALLLLATIADVFIDRPLIAGAALIFVASAIYLFLQLPEHGPSRRDWPDDGAVL